MSQEEDFALVQALIYAAALMDAEQEQPKSGFTDMLVPVQVCFTPLSSPSFEAERSEPKTL